MEPDRSPSHESVERFELELERERERVRQGKINPHIDYEALILAADEIYDPSAS